MPAMQSDGGTEPQLAGRAPRVEVSDRPQEASRSDSRGESLVLVSDERGHPVRGATVYVLPDGAGPLDHEMVLYEGVSDDGGRVPLPMAGTTSTADIAIRAPGFVGVHRAGVRVEASIIEVSLQRGASLAGTVVDPDGSPIAGAAVRALGADVPFELGSFQALPVRGYIDVGMTTSDASGSFRIDGLRSGVPFALVASKPGFGQTFAALQQHETVLSGAVDLVVTLSPCYRLRYEIVDAETGEAPADAKLWPELVAKSAPEGASRAMGLIPHGIQSRAPWSEDELWVQDLAEDRLGPVLVELAWPGYEPLHEHVYAPRWTSAGSAEPHRLALRRARDWIAPGSLTIHFRQPDGTPVVVAATPKMRCSVVRLGDAPQGLSFRFQPDGAGAMRFSRVPPGEYRFASHLGSADRHVARPEFVVSPGRETTIEVDMPFMGEARFVAPPGSVPPFARIAIRTDPPSGHPRQHFAVHFPMGVARFPCLPEGRYLATVTASGISDEAIPFEIRRGGQTDVFLAARRR